MSSVLQAALVFAVLGALCFAVGMVAALIVVLLGRLLRAL